MTEFELIRGRIEVSAWDPESQLLAGRVFADDDDPIFVFYFDRNDETVLGRSVAGVEVPPAEIAAALSSNDAFVVADVMAALARQHIPWDASYREELFTLLDGGPDGQVDIAWGAGAGLYELADGGFLGTRTQISSFVPASPRNVAQVNVVRANFEELFAGRDRVGDEPERSFPGIFESQPSQARSSCRNLDWEASCGITITLFCSGLAYWNEGNTIVASEWSGQIGAVNFPGLEPDMTTVGLDIDAATWINDGGFAEGRHPRKAAAINNGTLEDCTV